MQRRLTLALVALVLTGCASYVPSIPADYSGPEAKLDDSAINHSSSKADLFYVSQINGADIDNSRSATLRVNNGRGMNMTPEVIQRYVIAEKPMKVAITGRTVYAAPILELTGTVYQVKGVVEFTPKDHAKYVVRGVLGADYSAVWIEDTATRQPVGNKIEVKGSSELGLLQK